MPPNSPPSRIISLVPSLTEALFAFGAGDRVVGRTRYCHWPPGAIDFLEELAGKARAPEAGIFLRAVERAYRRVRERVGESRRVFVPIWKNPYMTVGFDTYVHDVLTVCGGENIFGHRTRYPEVTLEEVEAARPEVILLPDEPYPFSAGDLAEIYALDAPAVREDRVHLVDGKLLTWYGPRMASSLTQLSTLLARHPPR